MYVGGQAKLGNDGNPRSGHTGAVGLFKGEVEVRRLQCVGDFLAEFGEELCQNAVTGQAFAVFGLEESLLDDAVGIDEEISGPRKAFLHTGSFVVEDTVFLDDFRVRIGEERIGDVMAAGEKFQNFLGIVADGGQPEPLLLKSRHRALQLNQLPLAKGSPIRGTEEEKHGPVRALQGFERLDVAEFVAC